MVDQMGAQPLALSRWPHSGRPSSMPTASFQKGAEVKGESKMKKKKRGKVRPCPCHHRASPPAVKVMPGIRSLVVAGSSCWLFEGRTWQLPSDNDWGFELGTPIAFSGGSAN